MRKIAIANNNINFINDLSTRILLNEGKYSFEVVEFISNLGDIDRVIDANKVDEIVISEDIMDTRSNWDIVGPVVRVYTSSMNGVNNAMKKGIQCYGVAKTAGALLDIIDKNEPTTVSKPTSNNERNNSYDREDRPTNREQYNNNSYNDPSNDIDDFLFGDSNNNNNNRNDYDDEKPIENRQPKNNDYEDRPREERTREDRPRYEEKSKSSYNDDNRSRNRSRDNDYDTRPSNRPSRYDDRDDDYNRPQPRPRNNNVDRDLFGEDYKERVDARTRRSNIDAEDNAMNDEYLSSDVSGRKRKKKAVIITPYSAKGGAGKTTIACNIATYLSMTSNGRRKNRVCIIDYNFDFGDVLNTLSYDSSGVTMMEWAMDIQDRMDNGESIDSITYNKEDIERYLQVNDDSGLFALLAPAQHIDSLAIHGEELKVMINNIIKYGDFDYVVCDTGNNTRNSSMLSLEKADHIIMIATQDVTTVHDNRSFLDAIKKFNNVDENRILLVINKAKSKKETLISCKEVEDILDIPCVAHLKEDSDVIKANNTGRPIVYNKNHEYTKGIANIVARITGIGTYEPVNSNGFSKVVDKIKYFFGF